MRTTRSRIALLGAAITLGAVVLQPLPVHATASIALADASGVDRDAACYAGADLGSSGANGYASPGGTGCPVVSAYDGSTEGTDLQDVTSAVQLETTTANKVVTTFKVAGYVPPPGSTTFATYDLPSSEAVGTTYRVLFANEDRPPPNFDGTCASPSSHSWDDGYRSFLAYSLGWDGTRWVARVEVGLYDPSPAGGFFSTELGYNGSGSAWSNAQPGMVYGTNWNVSVATTAPSGPSTITVSVDGTVRSPDLTCPTGIREAVLATSSDDITLVSGASSTDKVVTLPVILPLSLLPGFSDIGSVGGFSTYSDFAGDSPLNKGATGDAAWMTGESPCIPVPISGIEFVDGAGNRTATPGPGLGTVYHYGEAGTDIEQTMPPPAFNALTASDQELEAYGFPPRPTDAAGKAAWEDAAANYLVSAPPGLCEAPNVRNAIHPFNWVGREHAGTAWTGVRGGFLVPSFTPCDSKAQVNAWVGLYGDTTGRLAQAGFTTRRGGPSMLGWWQVMTPGFESGEMQTRAVTTGPAGGNRAGSYVGYHTRNNGQKELYFHLWSTDGPYANYHLITLKEPNTSVVHQASEFYDGTRAVIINERPTVSHAFVPLQDFGVFHWYDLWLFDAGGQYQGPNVTSGPITMYNSSHEMLADPSSYSSTSNAFDTVWHQCQ